MSFLRLANEIHFYLRILNDSQKTWSLVLNLISKAELFPAIQCFVTTWWSMLQKLAQKEKKMPALDSILLLLAGPRCLFSVFHILTDASIALLCVLCAITCPTSRSGIVVNVKV